MATDIADAIALRQRDIARLERVDQLRASPNLRDRFGAHAMTGQSAILTALRFIDRGDDDREPPLLDVVSWPAAGQLDGPEAEATHPLARERATSPLDGILDRSCHLTPEHA